MDFDGDGITDLISGSYDPGEVYLFRGKGKGELAARETITDKGGKPVVRVPDQKDKVESFGSWLALVDWDDDGDLDILLGGFDGSIVVRLNEGTRTKPAYATANVVPTTTDGKPLKVPEHHANPVVVDWDGDGRWDIVSGCSDGGVYFFRNVGGKGKPAFDPPVALLKPHDGVGYGEFLDIDEEPKPGIRSQIAVCDYNGDGKPDLLVGDFCTYMRPRADLTADQRAAMKDLRAKMEALQPKTTAEAKKLSDQIAKHTEKWTPDDWRKKQQEYKDLREKLFRTEPYKSLADEYKGHFEKLKPLLAKPAGMSLGDDQAGATGYVWLFLRK